MIHSLGKALAVTTLFLVSAMVFIHYTEKRDSSHSLVDSSILSKAGIKDLDVEYVDGKIYLNVGIIVPTSCAELIKSLKIQPIVIKSRTYQPTCSKISDTLMRVTYTQIIAA